MSDLQKADLEKLERGMKIAARLVTLFGARYLPIFNRLHAEVRAAQKSQDENSLALQIALTYNEKK